jgi:hypothetical protein
MWRTLFGVFMKNDGHPLTEALPDYVISMQEVREAWKKGQPETEPPEQNNQNFQVPKETDLKDSGGSTNDE